MAETPTALPFNPSPKARFQQSKLNIEKHRSLLDRVETQLALDVAILEYGRQLVEQNADANGAAANHFKFRGASEFVHVLKNLAEMPQRLPAAPVSNLDHKI